MARLYWVLCLGLVFGTTACSNKEQVYEGMYKGFSTADEMQMSRDPSYDPVQVQGGKRPSYQEYKRDREQVLKD